MNTRLIGVLLLFCTTTIYGQRLVPRNYDLKVGLTPIKMTQNYTPNQEYFSEIFDHQFFKIIQFYDHPTHEEKFNLNQSGAELIAYLPNYAWLVSFDENVDFSDLQNYNVRAIIDIPKEYKLALTLQLEEYPSHIIDGNNLKLSTVFFPTIDVNAIKQDLLEKGFQIFKETENTYISELLVPISKLQDLATLPYVQYIEPILPKETLDAGFVEDRSNERANYLASEQTNGVKYDGTGITIAVKEGGTVDPTYNNDFKGRLDITLDAGASTSSHKTGVARRMGAYGNDNPFNKGMAYGSDIVSTTGNFSNLLATTSSIAVNNSYGYGCYTGNYGNSGRSNDNLVRTNPNFMIIYSAGNIQTTDCNYGAGAGWGTITGDVKQAKNVIATGAVNTSDNLMGFSSWGPAPDGRIKPDICAVGPGGTSYAAPNMTGAFAQLYHAYFDINSVLPNSGLIKGILQNTAEDLGNPGPDFKYGYGRINMRRAYEVIANNTVITDDVANGATDNHVLNVPAGTKQIRIMVYWTDYEGTSGSSIALVNDLNLTVTTPNTTVYNPWILDHTINAVNLNTNATRGVDALNNMEQVTIDDPASGNYTISVNGFSVPQGPQSYYIIYEFLEDELTLTYPIGGESTVPNETERIYWDSYGNTSGTFDLSYSTDNGATWTTIVTGLSNSTRFYDWTVPSNVVTGQAKVKVERGALSSESSEGFSIIGVPSNFQVIWSCGSDLKLGWDVVTNATGYEIYKLGTKYMTSVGTTTSLHYTVSGVSTTDNEYFAVRALGANNAKGRRTNSLEKTPGDLNCIPLEVTANAIVSHPAGYYPDCYTPFGNNLKFRFLNAGTDPLTSATIKYQLDNGSIQTETFTGNVPSGEYVEHTFSSSISILAAGTYSLKAWLDVADNNTADNTITNEITIYSSSTASYPYTQTFDAFSNCSNSSNCNTNVCALTENWYNVPFDATRGDDADWLTDSGNTPTGGGYPTGPSGDHTSGSGKFLFTESSDGDGCQGGNVYALTPCIDLTGTTYPNLSFWYHMYGGSSGDIKADVLVDGEWTELFTKSGEQGNQWNEASISLASYIGKVVLFRFKATTGNGFQGDMAIDDIEIKERPPVEVIASEITSHKVGYYPDCYDNYSSTVSFKFQNFGTSALTTATMKYQLNSSTIISETFNGNVLAGENYTYNFSTALDLNSLTAGTYTLLAWIEATSDADLTNNTATKTFKIFNSGSGNYPYSQNFDAFTDCSTSTDCNNTVCNLADNWYNVPYDTEHGDASDWRTRTGSTPTRGGGNPTGPTGDHTSGSGKYLYTESSSGTGCQNSALYTIMPCIDLSGATSPELSFWYHMYGGSMGSLHVDVLVNGAWQEDIMTAISGDQGDSWIEKTIDLTAYVNKKIVLRFRGNTGGSWQSDMAIDDITVQEKVSLPVEMNSFTASPIDNKYIQLDWQTNSELNNEGFEIFRSNNGRDFEKIGFIRGQGTTFETTNYSFDDYSVNASTTYYYQLKQIDTNGDSEKSTIAVAQLKDNSLTVGEPFPNPTNDLATIRISSNQTIDFGISIYNQLGQVIEQQQFTSGQDNDIINFNTSKWAEGLYFITITSEEFRTVKKLIVKK